jgi:hypothetical protein
MIDTDRAAKLIRMLWSTNDGEKLASCRALTKMGIHEVAAMIDGITVSNDNDPMAHGRQEAANRRFHYNRGKEDGRKLDAALIKKLRGNLKHFSVTCEACGRHFLSRRRDRKTCSVRCRVSIHRHPGKHVHQRWTERGP